MNIINNIPKYAFDISKELVLAGYQSYFVGGCVRDSILKKNPKDFDLTTNATPDQVMEIFNKNSSYSIIPIGLEFGTVLILDKSLNIGCEVTTFRSEQDYEDFRHPKSLKFSDTLDEDLCRRDFTMNAIAFDSKTEEFVDNFGGLEDINNGIIRCVGDPYDRFKEDPLRMMRALRFQSQLNFDLDFTTKNAILELFPLLGNISVERIQQEFIKFLHGINISSLLDGNKSYKGLRDVWGFIFPEVTPMFDLPHDNPYHYEDIWQHSVSVLKKLKELNQESELSDNVLVASLFHDIGKPLCKRYKKETDGKPHYSYHGHQQMSGVITEIILKKYHFSNSNIDDIVSLVSNHDWRPRECVASSTKRRLNKYGEVLVRDFIKLAKADISVHQGGLIEIDIPIFNEVEKCLDNILNTNQPYSLKDLAITGTDIMVHLSISPGKQIGEILNWVLNEVIEERLENTKEVILQSVSQFR